MTEKEICYYYRNAKKKAQQIQILAELNDINSLEIIKILVRGKEELPKSTLKKLYMQLDNLETQIREKEQKYKEIVAALKGEEK
ncbi:MAG: hypothetical protein OSJ61_11165 [Lachnospiraceae bacterium]|jgi:hypothetical protein|nr:hypothetical protein [Lachnospiraceae bacterium]